MHLPTTRIHYHATFTLSGKPYYLSVFITTRMHLPTPRIHYRATFTLSGKPYYLNVFIITWLNRKECLRTLVLAVQLFRLFPTFPWTQKVAFQRPEKLPYPMSQLFESWFFIIQLSKPLPRPLTGGVGGGGGGGPCVGNYFAQFLTHLDIKTS